MSTLQVSILVGVLVWVGLCAVLALFFKGARRGEDRELEDMEQIAAVSQPASLDPQRPHVRAGDLQ